ncbi:gliding motility protein GldM [Ancylomarina sp. 16SWW S1-10-2]|uniref:type IX secretion system motor protein PorM/GldM n=1 Tax=Ancylomarina sp. 16SWW S1-10-2 TaxID=2499681 RepID=UPI0012AD43B5|nr:gliding motility protein GldM [Ancylomarina sp. 16SWW S1-10-2]MRT92443.1 gliding motility protein GldM [Ancylomarina sp. 16SWW S1-10-2]
MAASNCKETPRQKMIGMMYLFLTAMLAINVSNEVLDAFTIIDNGLSKTVKTFEEKNQVIYGDFKRALDANTTKVKPSWDKAQEIQGKANELCEEIQNYKLDLVKLADGPEGRLDSIQKKDNIDVAAQLMIVGGKGKDLKAQVSGYREHILGMIPVKDSLFKQTIASTLNTDDPPKQKPGDPAYSWESLQFSHIPLVGAVTLLSKLQTDIRSVESDAVKYLFNQIEAESFPFNKLKAQVIAKSNFVLKGDSYEAEVFLAASDTTQNPRIKLTGGGEIKKFDANSRRGIYSRKETELGQKSWGGVVYYTTPSGEIKDYPFEAEYIVSEPQVVVSPTKMNVFYAGVDNPVSVSAPGFTAANIRATVDNGQLIKKGKGYIARPKVIGKMANVLVEGKLDGKWRTLKSVEFRVKPIPDPVAMVAGKNSGTINKNLLAMQTGVDAVMDNFDFDLKFKIKSFTVSTQVKGFTRDEQSTSDYFTRAQIKLLKGLRKKQKVYIEDIKAVGPDGSIRNLPAISFRVK